VAPRKNGSSIKKEDVEKIKMHALTNLYNLKPPPTSTVRHHQPSTCHAIDDKDLYDQEYDPKSNRHREDDDPMERLHRLCGQADAINFFTELGRTEKKANNNPVRVRPAAGCSRQIRPTSKD
jgi:histone deacetylase 1/2